MMNLENIKRELAKHGIMAEQVEVVKNGVTCVGFKILTESDLAPVVYYSQSETVTHFLERIYEAMEQTPVFDTCVLSDRSYVLSHLSVSVQRKGEEKGILSRCFLNLQVVMRLLVDLNEQDVSGSVKVSDGLLRISGVTIEDAWRAAMKNMAAGIKVLNMADILGLPADLVPFPFYVMTAGSGIGGAAALLYSEIFKSFCNQRGVDGCIILPSSTEELIVVPDDGSFSYSYAEFAMMVANVNHNEVDPLIQLDPVAYRYDVKSDAVVIVAEV